jgi:hypothetical protein
VSENLREDIEIGKKTIKKERRIYIHLPKDEEHQEVHLLGQVYAYTNCM